MDTETVLNIEIEALRKRLFELEQENAKLKQIMRDNDIEDSDLTMSDEESICINEIRNLRDLSNVGSFGKEEAQILDLLYKNLRLIRGLSTEKIGKKQKPIDVKELFKIVEGNKP